MMQLELLPTVRMSFFKFIYVFLFIYLPLLLTFESKNICGFPSHLFRCADGQGPSGNKPSASTSLFHENDLAVSYSDLEKIFNSDEDDPGVS